MARKPTGLLPSALRGTKARHHPAARPTPPALPMLPPPKHGGMKVKMGFGIPGHNQGSGEMTGC